MRTTRAYEGVSLRDWSASVLRAVGLIRGGMTIEDAAEKAKADIESVRQAWAIHSATPEGKAHAKANERVKVLSAEERAKVEAELKARDGAPGLREQAACGAMFDAGAEIAGSWRARLRKNLDIEDAHRERDEAKAEVERLTSENEQLRGLLGDQRKLREQTEERLRVEEQQAAKAKAHADAAEAEVKHLAAQVRGIPELVAAVARIEAALAQGVKTQPSKPAAAVTEESAEEVAQLRAELVARTKERDASRAAMAGVLTPTPSAPRSSTCSTKGCGAPSKVKGVCMRCYKREWSARKAASR